MYAAGIFAVEKGDSGVVAFLVEHGADVNAKDNNGITPLMYAVEKGDSEVVAFLVEHGAKVNAKDNYGDTPISYARSLDHHKIAEYLAEYLEKHKDLLNMKRGLNVS